MLKVNLNAWKNKTRKAKEKIRMSATAYVRKKATLVYKTALEVSPQYSGNYVFNWQLVVTGSSPQYITRYKVTPWQKLWADKKQMGDMEAINAALRAETDTLENIKWNSNIHLVNMAPVHQKLEAKEVRLRPENVISGNMTVIEFLKQKYGYLK